jgi:4-amino-4-deoxy-L-arabinose transferase-like glycosyltransferase
VSTASSGTKATRRIDEPQEVTGRGGVLGLLAVLAVYLVLATTTAWLTPAWEANDEVDHVQYAQAVAEGEIPDIGDNIESAQPPLYYAAVAVWMKTLGIEEFTTEVTPAVQAGGLPELQLEHDYDPEQREAAVAVHWLRMLSVLIGLVTVVCTFSAGRLLGLSTSITLAATATVALWPKFLLVSATVQNDSLVTALCSVLILLALRWVRPETGTGWSRERFGTALAIGGVAGAAALTKYTALPLIGLLGLVLLAIALRPLHWRRLVELAAAATALLAVFGWWLLRNIDRYGDPLASEANTEYLRSAIPGLAVSVPFVDGQRFGEFVPRTLLDSTWYIGGWNQFLLPFALNLALTMAAGAAVVGALRVSLRGGLTGGAPLLARHSAVLWAALTAAFVGVLLIARETTQAQGRYLFVGMVAIALFLVVGTAELTDVRPRLQRACVWLWPVLMALTSFYAAHRYLVPFAGL